MSASLLRTADMQRLRFREDLNTPDAEFFIRLATEGARFVFLPDYLMEYRVHLGAETVSGLVERAIGRLPDADQGETRDRTFKRQFLTPIVVNAVSRSLQQGNMEMARKFLRNEYYPRWSGAGADGSAPRGVKRVRGCGTWWGAGCRVSARICRPRWERPSTGGAPREPDRPADTAVSKEMTLYFRPDHPRDRGQRRSGGSDRATARGAGGDAVPNGPRPEATGKNRGVLPKGGAGVTQPT